MSAFNTLIAEHVCPICRQLSLQHIQFKFGDCWGHRYRIGDALRWGGNEVGTPVKGEIKILGASARCENCGAAGTEFAISIVDSVILRVTDDIAGAIEY